MASVLASNEEEVEKSIASFAGRLTHRVDVVEGQERDGSEQDKRGQEQ
jgi:hypothetical protein